MILGAALRLTKNALLTPEQIAAKASILRASGRFYEAEAFMDPQTRTARAFTGILGRVARSLILPKNIEDSARINYLSDKLLAINAPITELAAKPGWAALQLNQFIKAYILHPPFEGKENLSSEEWLALRSLEHFATKMYGEIHYYKAYAAMILDNQALAQQIVDIAREILPYPVEAITWTAPELPFLEKHLEIETAWRPDILRQIKQDYQTLLSQYPEYAAWKAAIER